MGKHKKESLEKLLPIIYEICESPENSWFKEKLIYNLSDDLYKLADNLRSTTYYLKTIDKEIKSQSKNFYLGIKDKTLKAELVKDHIEMKIADREDNIIEYTRRVFMQLENCINYICKQKNAHNIISHNPNLFMDGNNDLSQGEFSFFSNDGGRKPLNLISITSKVFFIKQHYGINYSFNDMMEMNTIRNKSSHRGSINSREMNILLEAYNNVSIKKARYFQCYFAFYNKMKSDLI